MVRNRDLVRYIESERIAISMSTELKIQANRANAQWSTGPRTAEGKAQSAQNARKHGLSARQLAITPEDREAFDALLAHYQQEINPRGAVQQTLFDELVAAAWNLRRVRILQAGIDMLDPAADRLARHHTRIERTFHRSLKELKAIQTDSAVRATLPIRIILKAPPLAAPLVLAKRSQQREQQRAQRLAHLPSATQQAAAA